MSHNAFLSNIEDRKNWYCSWLVKEGVDLGRAKVIAQKMVDLRLENLAEEEKQLATTAYQKLVEEQLRWAGLRSKIQALS